MELVKTLTAAALSGTLPDLRPSGPTDSTATTSELTAPMSKPTATEHEDIPYYPSEIPFDWQIEKGNSHSQLVAIKSALDTLRDADRADIKVPFSVPRYPSDPRASFALALIASHNGDNPGAIHLCRKSLSDAEYFGVPFALPVRLLNKIQIDSGNFSDAISECCILTKWISDSHALGAHGGAFAKAHDELAWWSGVIACYCEYRQVFLPEINTACLEALFVGTPHWEKYQSGRTLVDDRQTGLLENWKNRNANQTSLREQIAKRKLTGAKLLDKIYGKESESSGASTYGSNAFRFFNGNRNYSVSGQTVDRDSIAREFRMSLPEVHRVPLANPAIFHFSNYFNCDLKMLSAQTLSTLPKQNYSPAAPKLENTQVAEVVLSRE